MYFYKNNRGVSAAIVAACIILFLYMLADAFYGDKTPQLPKIENDPTEVVSTSTYAQSSEPRKPTSSSTSNKEVHAPGATLTRDDVLVIMKTGGTTMWNRLLIYLTTIFAGEETTNKNIVIYSDHSYQIGRFEIIDVLANMTEEAKAKPDFDVYRQMSDYMDYNYYLEQRGLEGDEYGPSGGWIIDKYKFIPIMQHAGLNYPDAKWYFYMEDDTYLFLPNVLRYLSNFDWRKPHYLGGYAAKSDVIFAHGGSGFVLSRGAWETTFGRNSDMAEKYYQYTADHCCGDQILGLALKDHGVKLGENGGDERFIWGFNDIIHWSYPFGKKKWCWPLYSWHKVHSRDVQEYHKLEKWWDYTKPLLYGDFFVEQILPKIQEPKEWWDNMAKEFEISSRNKLEPPSPKSHYDSALWSKAWESVKDCEAACRGWDKCMQWTFVEDLCKMDSEITFGQGYAPPMPQRKTALKHTSGWLHERLDLWKCP